MSVVYDFSGKTAVVTGGSDGIGAAIAERLFKSGANICVWDLKKPNNENFDYYKVDVCNRNMVEGATSQLIEKYKKIDILINNAGFAGSTVPIDDYDPDEWRRIIDVNLTGVFEVCRNITKHMRNQGYGRIVNMSSLAGKEGTPNASAYSAAKAGVIAMTKSIGKEFAEYDIRANTIAPAAVKTAILDQMAPSHVKNMINKSPLKRLGTVNEVAELALWLSSDACSFNTGAVFDLSGGRATY